MATTTSSGPSAGGSFLAQLFTFRGRANRGKYWLSLLLLILINMVIGLLVYSLTGMMPWQIFILPMLGWLVTGVAGILVSIRRLHDCDKSGHWLWLFMLVPGVLNGIAGALNEGRGMSTPALLLVLIGFGVSVWGFVELGCLRGTEGPNQYGQDPLQGTA